MMVRVSRKHRRNIILAVALLVSLFYVWQLVSAWDAEQQWLEETARQSAGGSLYRRVSDVVQLTGKNVATGATGTLGFSSRNRMGFLRLQDMPVLPASMVYQLWC